MYKLVEKFDKEMSMTTGLYLQANEVAMVKDALKRVLEMYAVTLKSTKVLDRPINSVNLSDIKQMIETDSVTQMVSTAMKANLYTETSWVDGRYGNVVERTMTVIRPIL